MIVYPSFTSRCNFTVNMYPCYFSWRREQLPPPVFFPGDSHGQRSLAGYSSWGFKESDTTEWLSTLHVTLEGGKL